MATGTISDLAGRARTVLAPWVCYQLDGPSRCSSLVPVMCSVSYRFLTANRILPMRKRSMMYSQTSFLKLGCSGILEDFCAVRPCWQLQVIARLA